MNRYRVPKQRVPVRLSFRGQPEERVHLFLSELAETHAGRERPSDLLDRAEAFIAVQSEGGQVDVLCRDALAFLTVPAALESEGADAPELADETRVQLTISLDDGREVGGTARYRLPESARRLQDFLNQEEAFLRLERDDEVVLVNKRCIVRVREGEKQEEAEA